MFLVSCTCDKYIIVTKQIQAACYHQFAQQLSPWLTMQMDSSHMQPPQCSRSHENVNYISKNLQLHVNFANTPRG